MRKLLLIDSHALIHRFFHALPPLTSPSGEPANSLYGLCGMILKILNPSTNSGQAKPDFIAAAMDSPEKTFREEEFKEYKAHRPPTANELISQIQKMPEVFNLFNIKTFAQPGFEADDIIGTLAEKFKNEKNLQIIILSGDNDLLQLVENEKIIAQIIKTGITETVIYNESAVELKYGLKPTRLPDLKGLTGDASDNIPGVKGVGPKTASELLKEFSTIEEIYENIEIIPEKTAKKLRGQKEIALISKKLALIQRNMPIECALQELSAKPINKEEISRYFEKMGFQSLIKRLAAE